LNSAHRRGAGDGSSAVHQPDAAILACSDARVPPSVVFDQPAGSLFVIRLAGNPATPTALASLDYAVSHLDTPLIIVLGHTGCGAVGAAVGGADDPTLSPIVGPVLDALRSAGVHPSDTDGAVVANVAHAMARVHDHLGPAGQAVRAGTVELRGAVHQLETGDLIEVDLVPPHPHPTETPCPPT
jgi:carbonic anhydrase